MICQRVESSIPVLVLSECPLIHNPGISSIVKNGWGYPWLETNNYCVSEQIAYRRVQLTSSTSQPPRLTPRTFTVP
jgi:hypothetical protein